MEDVVAIVAVVVKENGKEDKEKQENCQEKQKYGRIHGN